jgi:hypothetical protein
MTDLIFAEGNSMKTHDSTTLKGEIQPLVTNEPIGFEAMIEEKWELVADEPVEFEK